MHHNILSATRHMSMTARALVANPTQLRMGYRACSTTPWARAHPHHRRGLGRLGMALSAAFTVSTALTLAFGTGIAATVGYQKYQVYCVSLVPRQVFAKKRRLFADDPTGFGA